MGKIKQWSYTIATVATGMLIYEKIIVFKVASKFDCEAEDIRLLIALLTMAFVCLIASIIY